jgi:hypothetical protein
MLVDGLDTGQPLPPPESLGFVTIISRYARIEKKDERKVQRRTAAAK